MSAARGVRLIDPDGNERIYTEGREITRDGYLNYEVRGSRGEIVATRHRDTVIESEVIYS